MKPIPAICNEGCNKPFEITDMPTLQIDDSDVEITCFYCTHCNHRYVAFYTDAEVRKLQEKIRKVQKKFTNPNYDHKVAAKPATIQTKYKTNVSTMNSQDSEEKMKN